MKTMTFIYRLALCMLAVLFYACNSDEDFEAKYGSGSPLAENVTCFAGYEYSYNEKGLVTQMRGKYEAVEITYPENDRAVMVYYQNGTPLFTYVFAFGENHFANRAFEQDYEGESFLHKFYYDKEGHLVHYKLPEEELRLEWTDGNLTKVIDDPSDYEAYTILAYGSRTDFAAVKMNPFLLDVDMGPFTSELSWWFECGLNCALSAGFLGKPCVNLPATLESHDNQNEIPTKGHFEYYSGFWKFLEDSDY